MSNGVQNVRGQNLEGTRALGDRKGGGGSKSVSRVRGNSFEDEDMTLTREALSSLLLHARGRAMPEGTNEDADIGQITRDDDRPFDPMNNHGLGIAEEGPDNQGDEGERGGHMPTEMGDSDDGDVKALADFGDTGDKIDDDDEVLLLRNKATKAKSR